MTQTSSLAPPSLARSFEGRFHGMRVLKRAEGLETLVGKDAASGADVVVKVVPARLLAPAVRARLEYEIGVLHHMGRASPSPATQLLAEDNLLAVVREELSGPSLEEWLERRALSPRETVAVAVRVLAALKAAHTSGVLHRDVKPSNVILVGGRPDEATLVDFGLARHFRVGEMSEAYSLRAARHLSPEQLGLTRGGVDARSDLYSVGAMLHEALTRRPVFNGGTVGEILRSHLTVHPAMLRTLVPSVPLGLERAIEHLLRKDPRDRYQTAAGALADFEDLARLLDRGIEEPEIVVGSKDVRRVLTEPVFVERSGLEALETAREKAQAGAGELVVLEAESGCGKTWLLDEVGRRAAALGVWVLRGRAVDQAAQQPYQLLSGVVGEIVARARTDAAVRRRIVEGLGPLAGAACASLPELGAIVPETDPRTLGPESYGEARSLAALTALLESLGSEAQPALVLLDDGQWADDATVRLLEQWHVESPKDAARYATVVIALRPEDVGPDHRLRALRASRRLTLAPFSEEEVRRQAASMAGKLPEEALKIILRNSGGNPFLVSALLVGLVEAGALVSGPTSWQLDAAMLPELQADDRAGKILTLSIAKLDERARELLTASAVLGRTFDPVLAGSLIGMEPPEAVRLVEACRGRLVWAESEGGSFTFIHDKIREALLARISESERPKLHLVAAERIEREDPSRAYELAYHFDAAGEPERALDHALAAAEQARAQFALELAERHYRIAERGAANAGRSMRFRVAKELGEILTLRSRYDEADRCFEEALTLASERRESAEVAERRANLEMKRGDMRAACQHGEAALRLMGKWVPRSKLGCVLWSLWELVIQVLHVYFPRFFVGRKSLEGADDELFVIRVFHALNGPYFFSRGVEWAGWAHLRLINLAERYPPCRELGRAYAAHAVCLNGFPSLFERGLRISKEGADLCERMGDPWGQAQGLTFHAMMLHYLGRFAESHAVGVAASELFDRTGDRWEGNSGLDFAVDSLFRMGDLKGAVRLARTIWQRGHEIRDSHALAWSLDAWSRATDGKGVPKELLEAERSRKDHFVQTSLALDQAEGLRLLGAGQPREAAAVLEEARRRNMKEAGFFYDLNAPILVYLVTAYRMQAEATSPWTPGERARLLDEARRANKRSMGIARKFRNNLAHALRESAYVAAMLGDAVQARAELDESIAVAEALKQRYELALSRETRGALGGLFGWEGASAERQRAEEELRVLRGALVTELPAEREGPETETFSLVDRFATLLLSGRALATALTETAVYAELESAALALLRAERSVLFEVKTEGEKLEILPVYGGDAGDVSTELVRRAVRERRAIARSATDRDLEPRGPSIRSALCVPIVVRSNLWGCLYVVHSKVDELFGEPEERIGDFLGTLAGAALENAHGFGQIQAFSRVLETRVEQRTAELEENLRRLRDTQEQLIQAGKMAAMGTLVAGLSHELNNPLGIIIGYVHALLQQFPAETPAHRPLSAIERQVQRCILLVRALLDFSRTKASSREKVRVVAICDNVLQLVAGTMKTRKVRLETAMNASEKVELVVCPQEIESAILNLLSNAVDVSAAGGKIELGVSLSSRKRPPRPGGATSEDAPGIEFSVRDEGPGIPAEIASRIFDPFFTTKPVGQGTGLGLSLTRRIVDAHDGFIDVETAEGRGTRMVMWLPLETQQAVPKTDAGATPAVEDGRLIE